MGENHRHEAQIYHLRAVLRGISPLIWRRLQVESEPNRGRPNQATWRAYDEFAPGILANAASRCTESSPFRSATLTCARRCAPSSVHRICCLYGRETVRWLK